MNLLLYGTILFLQFSLKPEHILFLQEASQSHNEAKLTGALHPNQRVNLTVDNKNP